MVKISSSIWSDESIWSSINLVDRRDVSLVRYLYNIWVESGRCDAIILNGALGWRDRYCVLFAALVIKTRRKRPVVVLADCTWEFGSRSLSRKMPRLAWLWPLLSRWMIRFMDHDRLIYCVLSSEERANFAHCWNVAGDRVKFTPYCNSLFGVTDETWQGDYVFAGGNSMRDYDLLLAAPDIADVPIRIAAHSGPAAVPSNAVVRPLSHHDYMTELKGAGLVVVPLEQSQRSAGQQTYLNAMALGKITIVNDVIGVRDYINSGVDGLVVESTPEAISAAIRWARDPLNRPQVEKICENARRTAREKFSFPKYLKSIKEIAESYGKV